MKQKNIQNPTRIEVKRKQTTTCSKQNMLKQFGFKQTITKIIAPKTKETNEIVQTQIDSTNIHHNNTFKGNKISTLDKDCIRIFYLNINGINFKKEAHLLVQLYLNLKELGVNIISLTETNIHWKSNHIVT